MNWRRIAVLGATGGTIAALLARAATPVATPGASTPPPVLPVNAASAFPDVDRLRERLRPRDANATSTRNLFAFGRLAAPAADGRREDPGEPSSLPVAEVPPAPWRMIGIAEDPGPDGPVLTAIVSSASGIHLVKAGDALDGHRVIAVGPRAIELSAAGDQAPIVITLE